MVGSSRGLESFASTAPFDAWMARRAPPRAIVTQRCAVNPAADEVVIARLLDVISGHAPMAEAGRLLAHDVVSHMDDHTVRGIDVWFDWLEFLRKRAGGDVQVDLDHFVTHPDGTVSACGWLRLASVRDRTAQQNEARYRLEDGRIVEVWTTRANYEMIFGARVHHRLSWLLVLVEMALWRRLPWRTRTHSPDSGERLGDRSRNQPLSGGRPDDHPERRDSDRSGH